MKSELMFLNKVLFNYPQLAKLPIGVWRRNFTGWYDYQFANGHSRPPKAVVIKVNNICNMNCKMCNYANAGYFSEGMTLSETIFNGVIDEIYQKIPVVAITGGEPLISKNIIKYLRYAKAHKLVCTMVTNGWLLKERAEDIVNSGLDLLCVSIDGPNGVHDSIRRKPGAYDRALAGLRAIASYEKRPMLTVSTIIQAENYKYLDQLIDVLENIGIDAVNINLLWTRHPERAGEHNQLYPEFSVGEGWIDKTTLDVDFTAFEKVLKRIKKKNMVVNFTPFQNIQEIREWYVNPKRFLKDASPKCPWMWAVIFQDGTMRMCDDIVLGDLNKDNFWEIWNGDRMVKFRKILKTNKSFPICAGCCNLNRSRKI